MKRALVFSGGGSRGAYEIGAWQAMEELGIRFHAVYGTSIGAINAGLAAQGVTEVDSIHHIERGYQNLVEKLIGVGADIRLIHGPDEDSQSNVG